MALLKMEPLLRLGPFFTILLGMMLWERLTPRRKLALPRRRRWPANLAIVVLNAALVRVVAPAVVMGVALSAQAQGVGLLNQRWFLGTSPILKILLAVLALDFIIYLQHLMFHAVPVLWRLHLVHHADTGFDVTTALRFHPLEILISIGIKIAAVYALGAPAVAVLLFEVILNATAMFNHGNVRLAPGIDRVLRLLLVTPDMHRVHHSIRPEETNSNFGFNQPWWDRLCGTYRAQPRDSHTTVKIGLPEYQFPATAGLGWMLLAPFTGKAEE